MKIKKNGKVIRLNESDLKRIVKRTLNEEDSVSQKEYTSLPSCKEVMGKLAEEDEKKNCAKTDKDGKPKIGCMGTAREKVTLKMTSMGTGRLVAHKDGKAWCKCG